jgi:hypothetical protein
MIRIIIDKIDDQYTLDVYDTRNPKEMNLQKHGSFMDATVAAIKALSEWQELDPVLVKLYATQKSETKARRSIYAGTVALAAFGLIAIALAV